VAGVGPRIPLDKARPLPLFIRLAQPLEFAFGRGRDRLMETGTHLYRDGLSGGDQYPTILWLRRALTIPNKKPTFARQNENG
jgi:hypothetical protein